MSRKVIKRLAVAFAAAIALVTGFSAAAQAQTADQTTTVTASPDNTWQ
jgi:hypothetical protein